MPKSPTARSNGSRNRVPAAAGAGAATPVRLLYVVKQLQEALRARLDEITQQFDLTPTQYTALSVLARHPGISSAALGRLTFVSPQAANEVVLALERKGLLKRVLDRRTRRMLEVSLTRRGTSTLLKSDALVDELEALAFSDIDAAGGATFRAMLLHCLATLAADSTST